MPRLKKQGGRAGRYARTTVVVIGILVHRLNLGHSLLPEENKNKIVMLLPELHLAHEEVWRNESWRSGSRKQA